MLFLGTDDIELNWPYQSYSWKIMEIDCIKKFLMYILHFWNSCYFCIFPKECRGGSYVTMTQEIARHFSQDHARDLKLLKFKCWVKDKWVILTIFWMAVQKMDQVWQKFTNFFEAKIINFKFFQNFEK